MDDPRSARPGSGLSSKAAVGTAHPVSRFLSAHFPEETVGLLAGVALLLLPVSWRDGRFTLSWSEAVRIDWGTILVFAGGMALGRQLFDTGLARALGAGTIALLGQPSLWTLVAAGIVLSLIVSEAASNTASATVIGAGGHRQARADLRAGRARPPGRRPPARCGSGSRS